MRHYRQQHSRTPDTSFRREPQRSSGENRRFTSNNPFNMRESIARSFSASALLARTASSPLSVASDINEVIQSNVSAGNCLLPCPLCDAPLEPRLFRQHLDRHYPRDSPVCPVLQCSRRFAHPNSVRNHMRIKHTIQWAKMKAMRSSGGPFSNMNDYKCTNWTIGLKHFQPFYCIVQLCAIWNRLFVFFSVFNLFSVEEEYCNANFEN